MFRHLLWAIVFGLLIASMNSAAAQKPHRQATLKDAPNRGLLVWLEPSDLPDAVRAEVNALIGGSVLGAHATLLDRAKQEALLRRQPAILRCLRDFDCHELHRLDDPAAYALLIDLRGESAVNHVDYRIAASLLDLRNIDIVARTEESCMPCNSIIIAEQVGRMARRMVLESISRPRTNLSVSSNPAGARVLIDGRWVGNTPYEQTLFSGSRSLELRSDGFQPKQQTIELLEGQPLRLKLGLRRAQQSSQATILSAAASK